MVQSFRYRNVATNECNEVQSLEHQLLYCKHPDIVENREILYAKYCQYVKKRYWQKSLYTNKRIVLC